MTTTEALRQEAEDLEQLATLKLNQARYIERTFREVDSILFDQHADRRRKDFLKRKSAQLGVS